MGVLTRESTPLTGFGPKVVRGRGFGRFRTDFCNKPVRILIFVTCKTAIGTGRIHYGFSMTLRDRISLTWLYGKGYFLIGAVYNGMCAGFQAGGFSHAFMVDAFIIKAIITAVQMVTLMMILSGVIKYQISVFG